MTSLNCTSDLAYHTPAHILQGHSTSTGSHLNCEAQQTFTIRSPPSSVWPFSNSRFILLKFFSLWFPEQVLLSYFHAFDQGVSSAYNILPCLLLHPPPKEQKQRIFILSGKLKTLVCEARLHISRQLRKKAALLSPLYLLASLSPQITLEPPQG